MAGAQCSLSSTRLRPTPSQGSGCAQEVDNSNSASSWRHHHALAVPTTGRESLQCCRERGGTSTQTPWVQPAQAPLVSPGLFSERLTHTVCLAGAPAPCHLMVILQMSYASHWREWARPQGTRELQEKTATCPEAPRLGAGLQEEGSEQGRGLCSSCGTERVMVDIKGTSTFSGFLWPTISRVQSCPPQLPVHHCSHWESASS